MTCVTDGPLPHNRPRRWRRTALAVAVVLAFPVLMAGAAFGALLGLDVGSPPATVPVARAHDGLWLGHAWVGGQRTQADLDALITRLRGTGIRDLFVHAGPLSGSGSLNPALRPRARWLLAGLRRELPGIRVQAWLGGLVGPGHLDLAGPATRARVERSAAQVLAEGFGGVQYDLEPVSSGDPGYLALLAATHRLTRARHAVLSVACDQLEPLPLLHIPAQWLLGRAHWWSAGYLGAVAGRVDEVALMTYDSGVPSAAAYSGYVRLETGLALAAVPPRVTVLMGLPAYHASEPGHTSGETVAAAIRGVRLALGTRQVVRPFGVALYANFAATPADWAAYRSGWSRRRGR